MKKILSKIFINHFKSIFFLINKSESRFLKNDFFQFSLLKDCKLGKKGDILCAIPDQFITPKLLSNGEWEYFIIDFINKNLKKNEKYYFFDIGANIGLISRQLYIRSKNIIYFYCIEPEKRNYTLLKKNLSIIPRSKNKNFNFGLINNKNRSASLFLDNNNFGNYTILNNKNKTKQKIKLKNINNFFKQNIKNIKKKKIIYKSDVQGLDEILLCSLEPYMIDRIDILVLEISNFKFLIKNFNKFIKIINSFNKKQIDNKTIFKLDIFKKLISEKKEFNLLLAR